MARIKVVAVELDQPLPDVAGAVSEGYTQLQLLVRKASRPVGYVFLVLDHQTPPTEAELRTELARQLSEELARLQTENTLRQDEPLYLPPVTVALCTRNRPDSLRRALQSLAALDYPHDKLDILVVDNAPTDAATQQVVAEFPRFRYVVEPRPGLDWARNKAIATATGEIIAFTDDDVAVDRLWLRGLVAPFADPAVMCTTGLVAPAERETEAQDLFERYNGFGKGFEPVYYTPALSSFRRYFPLGSGTFGTGANMAFRRSVFTAIGSFDPGFDVGTVTDGGGDLDMFYRIVHAGYNLVYTPDALVWHYHRRDQAALDRQIRSWGRATFAHWTKVFMTEPTDRWRVVRLMVWWTKEWYVKGAIRNRGPLRRLTLIEFRGVLSGPVSYFIAQRQARTVALRYVHNSPVPDIRGKNRCRHRSSVWR